MFGDKMAFARKQQSLTQKQVAEMAKVQQSSYSAYENNKKTPPIDIASRIAKALDVSLDWLCGMDDVKKFTSCGEIARLLIALEYEPIRFVDKSFELPWQEEASHAKNTILVSQIKHPLSFTVISICNPKINEFITGYNNLSGLLQQDIIKKDVLDAWLEKKFGELDEMPLKTNSEKDAD